MQARRSSSYTALFGVPLAVGVWRYARLIPSRPWGSGIAPAASIAVDLAEPYPGLRSGTRASIKRAKRRGVRIRRATVADLPVVAGLLADTAEHHRFPAVSVEYLRGLHEALGPVAICRSFSPSATAYTSQATSSPALAVYSPCD